MGHKIITEKDFWICTEGMVPAQMQSTQKVALKKAGERYITVRDTSTSSWIDFSCTKGMLLGALIAAVVAVVVVAAVVTTGGAALLAVGLVAGLAGGLITAVKGALDCGQKMAPKRVWNDPKTDLIILGAETITGDCTMTCPKGGTVKFAPEIKNWWQAAGVGGANFLIKMTECGLIGAGVGAAAPAIIPLFTGGATIALPTLGSIGANFAGSFTGVFGGLRGAMALDQLPNKWATGELNSAGDVAQTMLFGGVPEAEFIHRVATGGSVRPADALLLLYLLNIKAKTPTEPATAPRDEPNAPREEEPARTNEEEPARTEEERAAVVDEAPPSENTPRDGEFDAFEDGQTNTPTTGETPSTTTGKEVHKTQSDIRRESGEWSEVNTPITDKAGNTIRVPKRVNLKTGEPQPDSPLQEAIPDAVNYERRLILDDKPAGRPIAKDRQEIIRFIKAYQIREGVLPERIVIQRYDPVTGQPTHTEIYTPEDFLP